MLSILGLTNVLIKNFSKNILYSRETIFLIYWGLFMSRKVSIPIVKYQCPTCGLQTEEVGFNPLECTACGNITCSSCSQKSICRNCLTLLTPEESARFQTIKIKHEGNFLTGFIGIVGGSALVIFTLAFFLKEQYLFGGIGVVGIVIFAGICFIVNRFRKKADTESAKTLQDFAELIRSRRINPGGIIIQNFD